jgi:hypothetical protein
LYGATPIRSSGPTDVAVSANKARHDDATLHIDDIRACRDVDFVRSTNGDDLLSPNDKRAIDDRIAFDWQDPGADKSNRLFLSTGRNSGQEER